MIIHDMATAVVLWNLWHEENNVVHGNFSKDANSMLEISSLFLVEYQQAKCRVDDIVPRSFHTDDKWLLSPS